MLPERGPPAHARSPRRLPIASASFPTSPTHLPGLAQEPSRSRPGTVPIALGSRPEGDRPCSRARSGGGASAIERPPEGARAPPGAIGSSHDRGDPPSRAGPGADRSRNHPPPRARSGASTSSTTPAPEGDREAPVRDRQPSHPRSGGSQGTSLPSRRRPGGLPCADARLLGTIGSSPRRDCHDRAGRSSPPPERSRHLRAPGREPSRPCPRRPARAMGSAPGARRRCASTWARGPPSASSPWSPAAT